MKVRIGDYIWLYVPSLFHGYVPSHKCGVVKMGFDGEYIEWYA